MEASYKAGFFIFLLAGILFSGCDEGCTDRNALNYDSLAKKDDGSCIYCDNSTETLVDLDVIDHITGTEFQGQVIARAHVTHIRPENHFTECSGELCRIYYEIENLTDKRVNMTYLFYYNGNPFQYTGIDVPAFQTSARDSIIFPNEACAPIVPGATFVQAQTLIYH